jgi:hypothetical protein
MEEIVIQVNGKEYKGFNEAGGIVSFHIDYQHDLNLQQYNGVLLEYEFQKGLAAAISEQIEPGKVVISKAVHLIFPNGLGVTIKRDSVEREGYIGLYMNICVTNLEQTRFGQVDQINLVQIRKIAKVDEITVADLRKNYFGPLKENMTTADIPVFDTPTGMGIKRVSEFDPYAGAQNVEKNSKSIIKMKEGLQNKNKQMQNKNIETNKFDFLKESFYLKNHNLLEATNKSEKFSFLIETNNSGNKVIKISKDKFKKFVLENCAVEAFITEGKFNFDDYISNRSKPFVEMIFEAYLEANLKKKLTEAPVRIEPGFKSYFQGLVDIEEPVILDENYQQAVSFLDGLNDGLEIEEFNDWCEQHNFKIEYDQTDDTYTAIPTGAGVNDNLDYLEQDAFMHESELSKKKEKLISEDKFRTKSFYDWIEQVKKRTGGKYQLQKNKKEGQDTIAFDLDDRKIGYWDAANSFGKVR